MDGYLSAIMQKIYALMICGWNGLHGMNPWVTEEDVIWKVKINYMAKCFPSGRAESDREQDGSFSSALQIVICLDGDHFINDICLSVSACLMNFRVHRFQVDPLSIMTHLTTKSKTMTAM